MIKDGVLNHQLQASSSSPLARLLCCAPELASQGERLRAALEEAAALQNEKHSLTQRVDQLVEKVFNSTRVLVLVLAARALQTAITHALTQHATTATPPPVSSRVLLTALECKGAGAQADASPALPRGAMPRAGVRHWPPQAQRCTRACAEPGQSRWWWWWCFWAGSPVDGGIPCDGRAKRAGTVTSRNATVHNSTRGEAYRGRGQRKW